MRDTSVTLARKVLRKRRRAAFSVGFARTMKVSILGNLAHRANRETI